MISVVICTYNRSSSLRRTLESLARMSVPPHLDWELIVVDNNSSDDTRAVVEEFAGTLGLNVRYVFEGNQGLSHARNAGVRHATGEIIAFTDDDVAVDPQWVANLRRTFDKFDCLGVAGKSIPAWEGLAKPPWLQMEGPYDLGPGPLLNFDLGEEPTLTRVPPWGLNMAFRRSAFRKHGLFRSDLGVSGSKHMLGEDTEFGRRLIRAGEKLVYTPKAVVFHPVDPKRLTKKYFLSYYYNLGRTSVREEGWPPGAICYFGVPRYIFRSLLTDCLNWLLSLNTKRRFFYKLKAYRCLGQIAEARTVSREKRKTGSSDSSRPAKSAAW